MSTLIQFPDNIRVYNRTRRALADRVVEFSHACGKVAVYETDAPIGELYALAARIWAQEKATFEIV